LELGGSRKLHGETTELAVAPETEPDDLPLATALRHGAGAREGLDIPGLGEAIPVIAELDEQARGQEVAGAWQRLEDQGIRVLVKPSVQLSDGLDTATHLGEEDLRQGTHRVAVGLDHRRGGRGDWLLELGDCKAIRSVQR
jgi:hypothetical protein